MLKKRAAADNAGSSREKKLKGVNMKKLKVLMFKSMDKDNIADIVEDFSNNEVLKVEFSRPYRDRNGLIRYRRVKGKEKRRLMKNWLVLSLLFEILGNAYYENEDMIMKVVKDDSEIFAAVIANDHLTLFMKGEMKTVGINVDLEKKRMWLKEKGIEQLRSKYKRIVSSDMNDIVLIGKEGDTIVVDLSEYEYRFWKMRKKLL